MARGQAQAANKQLNLTNSTAAGYGQNAASELGALTPQATSLMNSQGYDPATLSAITNAGMGAVNASFGDTGNQIARNSAVTRNPASVNASLDANAINKGTAAGQEAGNIQMANASEKDYQRQLGLQLMQGLYGTNVGAQTSDLGMGPSTLQARAAGGGWAQGVNSVLTGIGSLVPKVPSGGGGGGGGSSS